MNKKLKGLDLIEIVVIITIIAVLAAIIIPVIINQSHKISDGTVIDKQFKAAYTSTEYRTTYVNNHSITVPTTKYHPECYELEIQGDKNDKTVSYWFECPKEVYEKYSVGDYYPEKKEG